MTSPAAPVWWLFPTNTAQNNLVHRTETSAEISFPHLPSASEPVGYDPITVPSKESTVLCLGYRNLPFLFEGYSIQIQN